MFKKIILASTFFISTAIYAGQAYIGPMLTYESLSTTDQSYYGITPRLALGYNTMFRESLYVAAEIFASPKSITLNDSTAGVGSIKPSNTYGLSFIPGLYLDYELLGYLRFSVLRSKFESFSTNRTAGQIGIGLQTHLWGSWNIRGEYDYAAYQSVDGVGSPKADQFGIGTTYTFW